MTLNSVTLTLIDLPSLMNTSSSISSDRSSSKLSRTATLLDGTYGFMFNILHKFKYLKKLRSETWFCFVLFLLTNVCNNLIHFFFFVDIDWMYVFFFTYFEKIQTKSYNVND